MTLGWSIEAATFDSRRKRSRKRSSSRVLGQDELERDRALERELLGPVDDAHVAVADDLLDAAPGEDRARAGASSAVAPGAAAGPGGRRVRERAGGGRGRGRGGGGAAGGRRRARAAAGGGGGGAAARGGAAGGGGGGAAEGRRRGGRPRRRRPPAAARLDDLQGRLADPHRVARPSAACGSVTPLAVHERPVRRPEVLDGQPAAGVAEHARVAARELGVVAQPARPRSPRARSRARRPA